jgi:hypothetical protein
MFGGWLLVISEFQLLLNIGKAFISHAKECLS